MNISIKSILKGLLSYTPLKALIISKGTGGTDSARYCYSVWLRHLAMLHNNGMQQHPRVIAEIGPGDSLGVGLASLITGAEKYYAFDLVKHSDLISNVKILEELIILFNSKKNIPDESEFPEIKPKLNSYKFPDFLSNVDINYFRIDNIKNSLMGNNSNEIIKYIVPWNGEYLIELESVDLIISQAVMEHVIDLESSYSIMYKWLRKGGFISHQIDFRAHETHKIWNGHWKYPDIIWKMIMHGRSYPINRQPFSKHIGLIKKAGFEIINVIPTYRKDGFKRTDFKGYYSTLNDEDYETSSAHIIAIK